MKLELSNLVLKGYKKKNKKIALHLRSHLLASTKMSFNFTAYFKESKAWLTMPGQKALESEFVSISVTCSKSENIMIHDLHAKFELPDQLLKTTIANLRIMFHVNFTGQAYVETIFLEKKVVVIIIR